MADKKINKVILTILDGWGYTTEHTEYNGIEIGQTPVWHRLVRDNPISNLITFGLDVGLPKGQMGNSEVGHTGIGAGRIVFQELPKINNAITSGSFDQEDQIVKALKCAKEHNSTLHVMGLYSDGGVHAHIDHFLYTAKVFAKNNLQVKLHIFTDGRDTPPQSAINEVPKLEELLRKYPNIQLASVCGRYYSMDRDNRWDRIELAYNAMVSAKGDVATSLEMLLKDSYEKNITDEFIKPTVIKDYQGMKDNDIIVMINFRTDRAREILDALVEPEFEHFKRTNLIKFAHCLGMVSYSSALDQYMRAIYRNDNLKNTLGEFLSFNDLKQLRVAETEKYPHVTFFFSGGKEEKFIGEDRILIDSPKVATYDLKPEMSAKEITTNLVAALDSQNYDFIVVNYANGDMVGHTGVLEAVAKATSTVDECLQELEKAVIANNYIWLIIADHGNCETMWDFTNNVPHTQHTTNLVKTVLVNQPKSANFTLKDGRLADIAPTILDLMNLKKPLEMNGNSLLKK
ncbi:2,3-bisphosphoglycerate-independent phosphoglycerate mutase [Candidatus Hepatincolaceae symbiont of Richtersius coronifer]